MLTIHEYLPIGRKFAGFQFIQNLRQLPREHDLVIFAAETALGLYVTNAPAVQAVQSIS